MPTATVDAFAIARPGASRSSPPSFAGWGYRRPRNQEARAGGRSGIGHASESVAPGVGRVVVRVGEFRARTFWELERHARKLPWERFIPSGARSAFALPHASPVSITRTRSASLAVAAANRAGAAVSDGRCRARWNGPMTPMGMTTTIGRAAALRSFASAGCVYGERRQFRGAAPPTGIPAGRREGSLRETLAAAMLIACDWPGKHAHRPDVRLGNDPIEAALMARRSHRD